MKVFHWKETDVCMTLPKRKRTAHKGTYGSGLIVAGSENMIGCTYLTSMSALRTGIGRLTITTTPRVITSLAGHVLEATWLETKSLQKETYTQYSSYGIGPGCQWDEQYERIFQEMEQHDTVPLVVDASALQKRKWRKRSVPTVITPHPGEFARLTDKTIEEIQSNRIGEAMTYAITHYLIVVLKGHETVIAFPNGEVYINQTGNAALAKGGSGDVLTGMIVGLVPWSESIQIAVLNAVYLHGKLGEFCSLSVSEHGVVARDLVEAIPFVLHKYEQ